MGWPVKLLFMSLLGLAACQQRSINGGSRRQRVPAGKSEVANFNCPEDFGYYPHPSDCTQYYVCVFGGALQESCTGGLVYSHELQTCDWPRNVVCNLSPAGSGVSTVRITDPRTQNTNSVRAATEPLTPSVGSFDVRFQNSLSSSQSPRDSQSFSVFDGSDKNRQPKFLRQESEPQQSFTRFPQQSFFSDTDVQESSSRPINVHPTTNRSPVFPWWKLQSLGHGDLQSLEEKARPVRETSLAQFYRSGRDVTHLNDSTPDFDFGLPFVSAATPRFGQESQPHILSRRQQHQPKTFGAAPASFRNPKPRVPNPRPDQGISRRQSRPKNNFFNQGFPPNHFQTQQFSRFPPNSFSNPFHPHFPPQTSPANPFGNFQSFSHFSDDLDTRPFTLNHKPIGQPPSQQHVFPPRHPPNTTPRPDFSQFDENLQVGHFTTRPQGQLHVFPPRLPHSNFAHRPQNDPFATHLSHPRFPPGGTPVEPFVIEEALAHTSPQPPLRVTPLDHSISALRPPPPPPPPQNSVPNFPHEFPSHSQFPKVDDSEFRPHSKFSSDDVPEFPPHSQFPNVDEPEFPPHSQFPNVDAPEFPPHSQFSNADDPEFPSHSQFSSVDDTEFPPRSQFPTSNHFSESQFPTHPSPPPRSPPSPPPSPAPPTTNPPPEPEDPSLPPSVPEFSSTSRTPFATSEFSFIPDVNEHPIPRTTVSPNPSFNSITEKPHRVSTHAKPTTPPQPPSPSTFPPFSNVRPTFSSFQNPGPSKSQSALKSPGPPPQIPGTARHPELSKLSASNSQTLDSKTPSSTLSQDNRQPSRPQTSFNAAVTSRPVARPAPTRAPAVEDAFYSDYNLTDADYLYYYDDLLYDYYDITPTTTTRAPVRRPSVTSAPARIRTDSPSSSTVSKSFSRGGGPASVDTAPSSRTSSSLSPSSSLRAATSSSPSSTRRVSPTSQSSRGGQNQLFEFSNFDFESARASPSSSSSSSFSSSSSSSSSSTSSPSTRPHTLQSQSLRKSQQAATSEPQARSKSTASRVGDQSQSHPARVQASPPVNSQSQRLTSQTASQALRATTHLPSVKEALSKSSSPTSSASIFPSFESASSSSSSSSPDSSSDSFSSSSSSSQAPSVSQKSSRQPTSPNRGTAAPTRVPQRTIPATTGPISVDSVPKRNSRPTLKPVSVVAPTSPAIDIWKYPPQRAAPTRPQPPVDTKATKCDPKVCRLPDCYCGGKDVPDGIHPQDTPQMVLLTFDDSVNDLNKGLYTDLFENGRKNPNGCPIVSTMYVSHEWTDYSQVQNLYADGHEMASHSIQHSFGEQFSIKKWAKEIAGQREILAAYGGVKMEDVRGMRAPFLAVGGNKMFKMLYDQNFTYDSSMPVYENKPPSWPYTLDYKIFHDCMIPPCPTNSYPGVWEVPMVMWQDLNGGRCSMGDACTTPPDAEGVYKMLIKNFERHYTSNRAPFGLFYHAAWFTTPHHKEGFIAFLDTISAMDDVWLITNHQLLQWMRDPQPLSTVKNFAPFGCNFPDRKKCASTKVCNVWHKGGVRYMRTCQQCPEKYPWTGNTGVRSPLNDV
ncbi:uncharacterized protein Cda5 isoform X6 [Macrobrachium rosenbergii]|uniref:uncharacterized protein Cda5 isoform X6 n=1 Tax=Macrobrachium rosenbergii TaxID=79674 RepID=UPI0034D607EA